MSPIKNLKRDLSLLADRQKAQFFPRFFKSGPGEYGFGDKFIGVTVPNVRSVARKYTDINLSEIKILLNSKIHEERLAALMILIDQYKKTKNKSLIYEFYLQNTPCINNWDLVDLSAPKIVGDYLYEKNKIKRLEKLARSKNLWEKRIAILATFAFIKKGDIKKTFRISEILLSDPHDLIHKAVGWMLRETGKVSPRELKNFLRKNYKNIPRTTLRYAIERFPINVKRDALKGNI